MDEKEIKSHLTQVLYFLSFRSRSEAEIVTHLKKKNVAGNDIGLVVERVRELGLIDDVDFCRQVIQSKQKKHYGPKKIYFDLLNKGISTSVAKSILSQSTQSEWEESILSYLTKKRITKQFLEDRQAKQKLMTSLYARGFEGQSVKNAIDSLTTQE